MNGRLAPPKRFYEAAGNARAIVDPYGRIERLTDHLFSTFYFLLRTGDRELECRLITNAVGTDTRARGISKQRQDKIRRGKYCDPQRAAETKDRQAIPTPASGNRRSPEGSATGDERTVGRFQIKDTEGSSGSDGPEVVGRVAQRLPRSVRADRASETIREHRVDYCSRV